MCMKFDYIIHSDEKLHTLYMRIIITSLFFRVETELLYRNSILSHPFSYTLDNDNIFHPYVIIMNCVIV